MLQMCRQFKIECNCHSGPWTTKYNIGHQCCYNIHTGLPELCPNVGRCQPTLWHCCSKVGMLVKIQHWYTVPTTLLEYYSTLANVSQSCDDVAMLGFWSKYDIGTTFIQGCLDIHTTFLGHVKASTNERCHNIGDQRWDNVGTNVVTTSPQRWSVRLAPPIQDVWPRQKKLISGVALLAWLTASYVSYQLTLTVDNDSQVKDKNTKQTNVLPPFRKDVLEKW